MDIKNASAISQGGHIGDYIVSDVLGQGGFGITYLAQDEKLDRKLAIKEYFPAEFVTRGKNNSVQPNSTENKEVYEWGLARFLDEGKMLAKFSHPNIVRVLSYIEENDTAYIVMEFEAGDELQNKVKRRKVLNERELLATFLPVIDGLKKVHEAGCIHRDIKPANILLLEDGRPMLIDFGSAREAVGNKTKNLTTLVSPGYAPFEQYSPSSEAKQGPWTDIYALSASMYRCLFGSAPENAMSRADSILSGHKDPLLSASYLGEGTHSEKLLAAVDAGLAFKASERPQSLDEWLRMLQSTQTANGEDEYAATIKITALDRNTEDKFKQANDGLKQAFVEKLAITKYLVFGMLTLWVYTSYSLSKKIASASNRASLWFVKAFPVCYFFSMALVASWLVPNLFMGYLQSEAFVFKAIFMSATLFYLNTVLFVSWFMGMLKKIDFESLGNQENRNALIDKWEQIDNRTALFLVLSFPIIYSPYIGVSIYFADMSTASAAIMPVMVMVLGGIFHVWGTRLLINNYNSVLVKKI